LNKAISNPEREGKEDQNKEVTQKANMPSFSAGSKGWGDVLPTLKDGGKGALGESRMKGFDGHDFSV